MNARVQSQSGSRTRLLTNWVTVRGASTVRSVIQDSDEWIDAGSFADMTFYVDVSEITPPTSGLLLLYLETSATMDDTGFLAACGPIPLSATISTPIIVKSASGGVVPLARFVRWRVYSTTASAWDVTMRIRGVGNRATYFAPTQLASCAFWLRADLGLTFTNAAVTQWADQSNSKDPNKTLTAGPTAPTLTLSDATYGNQPTMKMGSNAYMTTASWATTLVQPDTWIVVGHPANTGAIQVALESNDRVSGQNIEQNASNVISIATSSTLASTTAWSSPGVALVEFNGASSNIFFNNFTTAVKSGTIGSGAGTGQASLTLGSADIAWNAAGLNFWNNGTIAEVIAFSAVLSTTQKQLLKRYLNNRYSLAIV